VTHRTVRDVMTRNVFTVNRYASYKAVAMLLADADVTAVPVVDAWNRPVGIVSEGDLLCKQLAQPEPEDRSDGVWLRAKESQRAEAETADALMTPRLFTAEPDWSVVRAAQVMDRHHIQRLPVVDEDGTLVGIVSRSDLLRVFLRPDREIHEEIAREVLAETLQLAPDTVRTAVVDGVVTLRGEVERRDQVPLLLRLCAAVDGVVAVRDELLAVRQEMGPSSP
jgi:CBS domain-containing protein